MFSTKVVIRSFSNSLRTAQSHMGNGAARIHGSGGTIRDAGGADNYDEYYHKLKCEKLDALKQHLRHEMALNEERNKRHQEDIERQKNVFKN